MVISRSSSLDAVRGGVFALACLLMTALSASPAAAQSVSGVRPANPQPTADAIVPGLATEYLRLGRETRHVDDVERAGKGHKGKPLEMIDYNTGNDYVLTSEEKTFLGARITGFIKFDKPGTYVFTTQSNDGVRLKIGGKTIIEDPDVHADQFSSNVSVPIATAGWYDFYIVYFQRKGTATLELYWLPPGADDFDFVPAEAFARPKG
jgi:hypothetical protein